MEPEKVMVAMSGGVDSSVAAYLLQSAGFTCAGGTMRLCDHLLSEDSGSVSDAKAVADKLEIPFYAFDRTGDFEAHVITPFIQCYEEGGTPNPCIYCNRRLKFDLFLQDALALGYDSIATGHYARIEQDAATGRYLLYRAGDQAKDQSYFLSMLTQEQLSRTRFPLGDLTKEQVRQIAQTQGFLNARKRDSQDICFIPDGDYRSFMEHHTGKVYPTGDYLDLSGNPVGRHSGAVGYTIGQRKGLGIALGEPVYVCAKDMEKNTVTVGPDEALYKRSLLAHDWNWIPFPELTAPIRATAKIRYRHREQPATIYPEADGSARVEFDAPQRAITTGQAVVLYDGDLVIGGGTITNVL